MRVTDFFVGVVRLSTPQKNSARLVNICMRHAIPYRSPRFSDGQLVFECDIFSSKKLLEICAQRGIELLKVRRTGLPVLVSRYKNRWGLLAGIVIASLILAVSFNTVWRVEVTGNGEISRGSVEALLEENGFCVGSAIQSADLTLLENRIMNASPDIAWISVNMDGTVARIEIRERKVEGERGEGLAHLTAIRDGIIERIEAYNGSCVVKVGDVVREGQLLVSGEYVNDKGESRFTRAEGEIYARTVRNIFVSVPLKIEEKVYTGRKKSDVYINFFKKNIKIFSNSGKKYPSCDIICKNGELSLFGGDDLPVGYTLTEYLEYEMLPVELSENEAMERAFLYLERELGSLSSEIELLRKNIEFEIVDGVYVLKCELVCIENIAQTIE